jgi:hypothetical protein
MFYVHYNLFTFHWTNSDNSYQQNDYPISSIDRVFI